MKIFKIVSLVFLWAVCTTEIFAETLALSAGGEYSLDIGNSIVADGQGNMYVAGIFDGTATFGDTTLEAGSDGDIFIAKLDAVGNWLWAKSAGGSSRDTGSSVAVDTEGNVYVTGRYFSPVAIFGPFTLNSEGRNDIFIAKLDTNGNWMWAKRAGGTSEDEGYSVSADADGNVYVTGYFRTNATFGETTLEAAGSGDIFITKLDTGGNWLWAKRAGGLGWERGFSVAVDKVKNVVYVTGQIHGNAIFGGTTLNVSGSSDIFIAKLDPTGNWLWAKRAGGVGDALASSYSVAVDTLGTVYITGSFANGVIQFGSTTLDSERGIFIAKLGPEGNWLWAKNATGSSVVGRSISVDSERNIYVIGDFSVTAAFGQTTFETPVFQRSLFVAKLDTVGNWLWAIKAEDDVGSWGASITADTSGNVLITGGFSEWIVFGNKLLDSLGPKDIFITKISAEGNWLDRQPLTVSCLRKQADQTEEECPAGFGNPEPAGTHWQIGDEEVTVHTDPLAGPYLCTGWTGTGSVPASGDTCGDLSVTLTQDSTITWHYDISDVGDLGLILSYHMEEDGATVIDASGNGNHGVVEELGPDFVTDRGVADSGAYSFDWSSQESIRVPYQPSQAVTEAITIEAWIYPTAWDNIYVGLNRIVSKQPVYLLRGANGRPHFQILTENHGYQGVYGQPLPLNQWHYLVATFDGTRLKLYVNGILAGSLELDEPDRLITNTADIQIGESPGLNEGFTGIIDEVAIYERARTRIWQVGQPITPPSSANIWIEPQYPDPETSEAFFWSTVDHKLYPMRPVSALLQWESATDPDVFIHTTGMAVWPSNPTIHIAGSPVDLEPADTYTFSDMPYTTSSGASIAGRLFQASNTGYSVLRYTEGTQGNIENEPVLFDIVRTVQWDDPNHLIDGQACIIGQALSDPEHDDSPNNGFVHFEKAHYDAGLYDRETRDGPIFPVNKESPAPDDDMVVVWYRKNATKVSWPDKPVRYVCQWPTQPKKLIIASQQGSGALNPPQYPDDPEKIEIYNQPDPALPGYNPNEEHAAFFPPNGETGDRALFALRSDLNTAATSEPYVLLKYQDPSTNKWKFEVYSVVAEEAPYLFQYSGTAGTLIQPPYPLSTMIPVCEGSHGVSGPYWEDYKGGLWAKAAGPGETTADLVLRYHYRMQDGFYTDLDKDGNPADAQAGDCAPWLNHLDGTPAAPVDVTYTIEWPQEIPVLQVGETLLTPKRGLPDIDSQGSVEVIYDEAGVRLLDPLSEREVALDPLPIGINITSQGSMQSFVDLPFQLRTRVSYHPAEGKLVFKGYFDESGAGEPLLLLNIMSGREKDQLKGLSTDSSYGQAVEALYAKTREQLNGQSKLLGGRKALTAGAPDIGTGYVTLAFGNDESLDPSPVDVSVIKVGCPTYTGQIQVIPSDDVFDERLTLRHSGDFGGEPDGIGFEWCYMPAVSGDPPSMPTDQCDWLQFATTPPEGLGAVDITIEGAGLATLSDNWFAVRYKGYQGVCPTSDWSDWTGSPVGPVEPASPQIAEGWIKRVTDSLNAFEARSDDFHLSETNTYVSMIRQAGDRYEGDVALNSDPGNLNAMGLIEAYTTILNRGMGLSIDASVDYGPANNALLNAAGRIADLYMLLGNEAFADASDPTIGFGTESGQYGTLAPSIFPFQNQLASLLEEELVLLRGRDGTHAPVGARPVYNRLFWNFIAGDGEVAYAQNYNITDQNEDGFADETDARMLYPQGHGDAWGHYLTAIKTYYDLLRHPHYTWAPRTESVLVANVPIEVDYLDERKFARAAAAKARTGAEIANLAYRQRYVEDPAGQWQGYQDTDLERAWGLDGWGRRAGQGAYFDWVTGNAILPAEDTDLEHTGISKVDRITVLELREIPSHFQSIQAQANTADQGLNPLGVAHGAVPFDIDPTEIAAGKTHFEQIYDRAVMAMNNAIVVFNHANTQSQLLRRQQDSVEDFRRNVQDREADFTNRLIEIFGYPYPEDIGPGGNYPSGYEGPDLDHYTYIDPSELLGVDPSTIKVQTFSVDLKDLEVDENGGLSEQTRTVTFHLSHRFGLIKPASWTGRRWAPGEIQLTRSGLLQNKARFERGLKEYENLLRQIEDQADLLAEQYGLNAAEIRILEQSKQTQTDLQSQIRTSRKRQLDFRTWARAATLVANAVAEFFPRTAGSSTDFTSAARGSIMHGGAILSEGLNRAADVESLVELDHQATKESAQAQTNIDLTTERNEFAVLQQVKHLEQLVRQEVLLRLEVYTLQETMQQAAGRYLATLARGVRLQQERERFRKQTAAQTQDYRYKDMTFRVFRNDALQKYRAQFDLAARYVYLAAKAYDYETNLLGSDTRAGQAFLTDIVRQRNLGEINNGIPLTGIGLADPLARMSQNFMVLKGQLGFNNPQTETNRFSLRKELFRIGSFSSNARWREVLEQHRVDNLWDLPEFRRYCRAFAPESAGEQPGLVIPFSTTVTDGLNYFGWPLGGGDSAYDPTHFATKVRSAGVWFSDYNMSALSQTPRVYLVPVGADVLRSPTSNTLATREWKVVDQKLPVPFPLGAGELMDDREWLPIDTLSEEFAAIRRFSRFLAYPYSGTFNDAETTTDSRLIGRSVWNTRWLLIIPGTTLLGDADEGLDTFIHGRLIPNGGGARDGNGVLDIWIFFQTYAYSGG